MLGCQFRSLDEAYNLVQGTSDAGVNFGAEAVAELLVQMENHRGDLVVISPGYPGEMDRFLDANAGLRSRFALMVDFPDYTDTELEQILVSMAEAPGYKLSPDLLEALPARIAAIDRGSGFANGRSVRGLLEAAIGAQAVRLAAPDVDLDALSDDELTLLTQADLGQQGSRPSRS